MSRARSSVGLALMILLHLSVSPLTQAVTTHWDTDNNGNYNDINNWNNGAPDSNDIAVFDRGEGEAYTVRFPGHTVFQPPSNYASNRLIVRSNEVSFVDGISPVLFEDSFTVVNASLDESVRGIVIGQLAGDAAFLYSFLFDFSGVAATIGDAELSNGELHVNAGTLSLTGSSTTNDVLIIGNHGNGVFNVLGGADVSLTGLTGNSALAQHAGSFGAATVSGAGSTWTNTGNLFIGKLGTGTLHIMAGGAVSNAVGSIGEGIGSNGTVVVDGPGSAWTNNASLRVGNNGQGSLTITGGGTVSSANAEIDGLNGVTGSATVDGAGSLWTNSGSLDVGDSGSAALMVSGGGVVSSSTGVIADADVADGSATITGAGSRWTMSGSTFYVGEDGTGTLHILDGGAVSNLDGHVGFDPTANGTVMVSGSGSIWTNGGSLTVGREGTGTLMVEAGSSVTNTVGSIGELAGSTGMATIAGAGSIWTNNNTLTIGEFGVGSLTIEAGGRVDDGDGGIVGYRPGSNGTVTVTGAGSTWTNNTNLRVGHFGTGALTIEAGGSVSNLHGVVGDFAGSSGTAIVRGAGSTWTNNGASFIIAHSTTGTLTIEDGGAVANINGYIGLEAGSSGLVTVTGGGSQWQNAGDLFVGGEPLEPGGEATLRIQTGGSVIVAQNTDLFADGHIHLEGGTLDSQSISFQGGGEFDWTSGTLHVGTFNGNLVNQGGTLAPGRAPPAGWSAGSTTITGSYAQQSAGKLEIEIGGTSPGSTYDVVNIASLAGINGQLQLALFAGFVPGPSDTFTVLSAASGLFGAFSNVANGQRLMTSDGLGSFVVNYGFGSAFNQNEIVLSAFEDAALPGDFNLDGIVDVADYVAWQKGGVVATTPATYNLWRTHYGETAPGSGGADDGGEIGVPEPNSLLLLVAAAMLLAVAATSGRQHRGLSPFA